MQKIKIQVLLLFSACTHIASFTDYSKYSRLLKTQNSVRKCRRISFLAVINSRKAEGNVPSVSGNAPEVSLVWL